jgi:hypothetical protein
MMAPKAILQGFSKDLNNPQAIVKCAEAKNQMPIKRQSDASKD